MSKKNYPKKFFLATFTDEELGGATAEDMFPEWETECVDMNTCKVFAEDEEEMEAIQDAFLSMKD